MSITHVQQLESRGGWFSPPPAPAIVGGAASRPPGAGSRPNATPQKNVPVKSIQTGCVVMSDPRRREEQHRALAEEEWRQGSLRASLAASVRRLYLSRNEEVGDRPVPVTRPAFFFLLFFLFLFFFSFSPFFPLRMETQRHRASSLPLSLPSPSLSLPLPFAPPFGSPAGLPRRRRRRPRARGRHLVVAWHIRIAPHHD